MSTDERKTNEPHRGKAKTDKTLRDLNEKTLGKEEQERVKGGVEGYDRSNLGKK